MLIVCAQDNLLFSCCCGKVNRGWTAVCDCNDSKNQYQCDQQCLDKTITKAELYFDYAAVSWHYARAFD